MDWFAGRAVGRITPFNWPEQTVALDGDGYALVFLTLPADSNRAAARQYARKALRQLLGDLLERSAEEVVLREGTHGPVLESTAPDIRISLSYAGDRCLIGLATGRSLGVDIVSVEDIPEIEALSRLYLPTIDTHALLATPAGERSETFALAWAQMEARSKCLGLPIDEISQQREQALNRCQLVDCTQAATYRIALAITP